MASEQYDRLNVQIDEESAGCCSSTKYIVLRYPMTDKHNPAWKIVSSDGNYIVEFTAQGNGRRYRHQSQHFSHAVKQMMDNNKKNSTKDDYEVRIEKNPSVDLNRYFL